MSKRLVLLIMVAQSSFLMCMHDTDNKKWKAVQRFRDMVSHFNPADLPAPFDEQEGGYVMRMAEQQDGTISVNTTKHRIYLFDKENSKWRWGDITLGIKEDTNADHKAFEHNLATMFSRYNRDEVMKGVFHLDIPKYKYSAKSDTLIYPSKASLALCTPFLSLYIDAPNPHASCFIQDSALNKDGTCAACLWTTEDKIIRDLNGIADSALCSRQLLLAHVADRSLCLTWHDLQQVRDDAKHQLFFDTKNRMHILTFAQDQGDVTHSIGVAPYQTLTHHKSWLDVNPDKTVNSKDPIRMGFVSNFPGLCKKLLSSQPYIEWDEQSKLPTLALLTQHLIDGREEVYPLPAEIAYKIMATYCDIAPKAVGNSLTFIYGSALSAQEKSAAEYLQWASSTTDIMSNREFPDDWSEADEWNAVKHAVAWEEVALEKTNGMTGEKKWIKIGEKLCKKLLKQSGESRRAMWYFEHGNATVFAHNQEIEIADTDTTSLLRSSFLEHTAALKGAQTYGEFARQCIVHHVEMPDDDTITITLHNKEQLIAKKSDDGKWYRDLKRQNHGTNPQ